MKTWTRVQSVPEVLKHMIKDEVFHKVKWTRANVDIGEIKMKAFTIFTTAVLDALEIDETTLAKDMIDATDDARNRDRTKKAREQNQTNKKRKFDNVEDLM